MNIEDNGDCMTKLTDVFSTVLCNSPVVIKVKRSHLDPQNVMQIVEKLKELQNVRFDE